MRLFIIIFLFSIISSFSQMREEIGQFISGEKITGERIQFESHIYALDYDSLTDHLIIQLRDVRGKNKVFKNTGELVIVDGYTLGRKWSKPVNYTNETIVYNNGTLILRNFDKSQKLDITTGSVLWGTETLIHAIDPKFNVGIGYNRRKTNLLQGVYLPLGNTLWSRPIEHQTGWKEYSMPWDSTMIVSTDALHTVNLMNGTGWDLDIQTFKKDYKRMVGMSAFAVVTGVLTGFYALPTGADYVGPLHSNLLIDDTAFYIASRSSLNKFNKQSDTLWTTGNFASEGSRSFIFKSGGDIVMINYGHANKLNQAIPFGQAFIARFTTEGQCLYKKPISSENLIRDFISIDDEITFLTSTELLTYSLDSGALKRQKGFRTEAFNGFNQFWTSELLTLTTEQDSLTVIDQFKILTGNGHVIHFDKVFEFIAQYEAENLFKEYFTDHSFSFFNANSAMFVIDKSLNQIAEIHQDMHYRVFDKYGPFYYNAVENMIYRFKIEREN
ncbi:MAG: hypothetical protein RJQ14_06555 [Marinoscillum sp.]